MCTSHIDSAFVVDDVQILNRAVLLFVVVNEFFDYSEAEFYIFQMVDIWNVKRKVFKCR